MTLTLRRPEQIRYIIIMIAYVAIMHICYICFFGETFSGSYGGKLFVADFDIGKYAVCIIETLLLIHTANRIIEKPESLTRTCILALDLLYFAPGFIQCAVLNHTWGYIFYYFLFWIFVNIWELIIRAKEKPAFQIPLRHTFDINRYAYILFFIALAVVAFLMIYHRKSFSVSNLIYTISDVYDVRATAKASGTHWLINNMKDWAALSIVVLVAFFTERRKWPITIILIFCELCLFLIRADRIIIFLAILAVAIGIFKIDKTKLLYFILAMAIGILIEVSINPSGGIITDIFRRYSIVPNRLGEQYFDFFIRKGNVSDFLRTHYDLFLSRIGVTTPYTETRVGMLIGYEYYGREMNSNNGLVGASCFEFGILGFIISSFGLVFGLRMFENATYPIRNDKLIMAIVVVLATFAINSPVFLAGIFSLSYLMPFYLCIVPFSAKYRTSME